jgi:uncharacterized membrane protein
MDAAAHLHASPSRSRLATLMLAATVLLAGATIGGLVRLWPHGDAPRASGIVSTKTHGATIERIAPRRCSELGPMTCFDVTVKLLDGPAKGSRTTVAVAKTTGFTGLSEGDRVRVFKNPPRPAGYDGPEVGAYSFADYDRRQPMLLLAGIFVALLLVSSRIAGLRALLGLGASLALVVFFVIPSILAGHSAVAVAIVGALAVLMLAIPLCYGLGPKAIAAWLGTALSLLLAVGLAALFTHLTRLTGAASEQALFLATSDNRVSVRGLLLAGMIVAALGVLVDLTVSQASTVLALRRANPSLGFGSLFRGALGVGNDHIAATVNTLVFAYAGASLPTLLIFSVGGTSFTDALNSETVAGEVVATLIGSIGLIASMPLTTALAALLAVRTPAERLGDHAGHAH